MRLARNITERHMSGLLRPLLYGQAAPVGFLLAVKEATHLFGKGEMAYRAVPLAGGVALLVLACVYAVRYLPALQGLLFVALLALTPQLIFYSTELKQYGGDAAWAMLLILLTTRALRSTRRGPVAAAGAAGTVAMIFSHPAVFTGVACGAVLLWRSLEEPGRRRLRTVLFWCFVSGVSFVAVYLAFSRSTQNSKYLRHFWQFWMRPRGGPVVVFRWVVLCLQRFCVDALGFQSWGVCWTLAAVGAVVLFAKRRQLPVLMLGGVALAMAAAVFRLYPFAQRFLLFSAPGMAVVLTAGAAATGRRLGAAVRVATVVLLAFGMAPMLGPARRLDYPPIMPTPFRDVFADLARRMQPGDTLYVLGPAFMPYDYYRTRYDVSQHRVEKLELAPHQEGQTVRWILMQGVGRFWIITSNYLPDDVRTPARFMKRMAKYADRLEYTARGDTHVALYVRKPESFHMMPPDADEPPASANPPAATQPAR